ncbi:MAG: phosphatidylserine decarboxylase family protein [Cyclobacteriaceae bacterium]|nr:phosphatidylserine decarboxylase family protein [Cyclobacteriaceae bacterium]MCH8516655.1 phosphatidylserine decarboxylase family protein [Cyclobacteriaceae bacterium]
MTIHKEGHRMLLVTIVVIALIQLVLYFGLPELVLLRQIILGVSVVIFLLFLQFFRLPNIIIFEDDNNIYSPADGKIVVIDKVREPEYFDDERIQVSIFMSPLNVHANFTPVAGKVKKFAYHPGKFLVAWHPKASTENERTSMLLETAKGVPVLVRQIAGAVARRIRYYVKEEQELKQGEQFGFIKFGSRVDVFLPTDARIMVGIDEVVKGGRTIIAKFK